MENDINAHIMVRINAYHDKGFCAVSVDLVPGLTMYGYNNRSNNDDIDDLFEKDCWWCGYDGRCDTCNGTGSVWNNIPGTSKYALQNCRDCVFGSCDKCGGDGNMPN